MEKNRYEFQINGNNYVLKTQRSKDETDKIVYYVDSEIKKAKTALNYRNPTMHATLACLNIADDLYSLELKHKELLKISKEPMEKYEPLKNEFDEFKELNKDSFEKIQKLEAKVKELENYLNYLTSDRDKFKLELDRQITLSEKDRKDNEYLREKLLEQEKETLHAKKQVQELLNENRK
ncbi:cell division protein ZapA [Helcococcus ovis]|uniref:Cell division protein ZapA n=1 Tax=Helcococcus ovis TaxID=72026 RepID=A0A4R9C257_9FIRM|nr:cell division protein ZapA [Helcococcus ovis]TFF64298.1 cell division protein ZapA [Helcococcus ovis]TFF66543.1 cell division protein ZapA [Helcococcus ovis]TFF68877.1 cell division protein ZapA [Helcococcus ovis]WNZ00692.1 cell division protein ZapA [Helcococcus ovis]